MEHRLPGGDHDPEYKFDAAQGLERAMTFPNSQQVTNLWNGNETQNGEHVTVTSMNYNATIPANGSYNGVGFIANWNGGNSSPTSFMLNGVPCR